MVESLSCLCVGVSYSGTRLIGWGRSEHPERQYQVEDYITTIIEFLEQTCEGAVTVVASSLTAAIVIRAAIVRPDLFKTPNFNRTSGAI